jgi:hypothetical protein
MFSGGLLILKPGEEVDDPGLYKVKDGQIEGADEMGKNDL